MRTAPPNIPNQPSQNTTSRAQRVRTQLEEDQNNMKLRVTSLCSEQLEMIQQLVCCWQHVTN